MVTEISKYGKMKGNSRVNGKKTTKLREEGGKNSHKPLEIDIDISQMTANMRERAKKNHHTGGKKDTYLRVET